MTYVCIKDLTIIGSDNDLSPGQCQAIIWTNAGILLIRPLGTNFSEILFEIWNFSYKKNEFENVVCEMASILSQPQCVNLITSRLSASLAWQYCKTQTQSRRAGLQQGDFISQYMY